MTKPQIPELSRHKPGPSIYLLRASLFNLAVVWINGQTHCSESSATRHQRLCSSNPVHRQGQPCIGILVVVWNNLIVTIKMLCQSTTGNCRVSFHLASRTMDSGCHFCAACDAVMFLFCTYKFCMLLILSITSPKDC